MQHTFLVRKTSRKRLVHVEADRLTNAVGKAFLKYPNQFITIKHARNMVLFDAKSAAAKESKAQQKPIYVIVDEKTGEADISSAPLRGVQHKFVNGVEDKSYDYKAAPKEEAPAKKTIPAQSEKASKLISKQKVQNMAKIKKAAKKATKPAKAAPAKKAAGKIVGEKKTLKIKQIIELMNKRQGVYRQSTGGKLSIVHMKAAKNKDHELAVTVVK